MRCFPLSDKRVNRRTFLVSTSLGLLSVRQPAARIRSSQELDLTALPNFCTHEHWGSIDSIGMVPEGFRADVECGATPNRETGILDILLDPYFRGWLAAAGTDFDAIARQSGVESFKELPSDSSLKVIDILRPRLKQQRFTGTYQCIRRGLLALYGVDLETKDERTLSQLGNAIRTSYLHVFDWYKQAMKKSNFTELVRPVHPEYYVRQESTDRAVTESAFTHTVMRVDPLMELWKKESPRRDGLARIAGIEPGDAQSWRAFISRLFELAAGKRAVGIKQLQAYSRPLEYIPRQDSEVTWSGDLNSMQVRTFQDWVMHECCKQAHERGWAHQVHVGTHNITQSSPMPLLSLAQRYPRMKIVMIHCWPFIQEAGWLAKHRANVFIDTCWQLILNPAFFRQSLTEWLNYVPSHKITCGHDATSIEMAAGSALFTREILSQVLVAQSQNLGLAAPELRKTAADFLHNNAVAIYGIGQTMTPS